MRGSNTWPVFFENCEVPAENVLGKEGGGVKVLMSGLDYERAVLSGGPLGIMAACMDAVLPFVHERKQFGQSIGEFQLDAGQGRRPLHDLVGVARLRVCGRPGMRPRRPLAHAQEGRGRCDPVLGREGDLDGGEAIQALGGVGYTNEYPVGRLWRDAKLYEIGAGTSEIRRMLIGRELYAESMYAAGGPPFPTKQPRAAGERRWPISA